MTVTVGAPGMTLLNLPGLVGGGLMTGGFAARLGATAHGGVTVRITSSNPNVLLVSPNTTTAGTPFVDIPVANGSTDASFVIHGVEGAQGTVTLTATAPGFTQVQGTATVGDVGLQLSGVSTSPTALSPNDEFSVNIGVLNASGAFASVQALRVGAPSVTVTVSHTNTAVGQLVTTSGPGQSRTVTIAAGQSNSPTTVAAGGVAFDPIGGGSTTVTATARRLPGGGPRDGDRERAGDHVAEPSYRSRSRSSGRCDGEAWRQRPRWDHRENHEHESQPAPGFAQRDDGGRRVHRRIGGQRQYRRDLFRAGSRRAQGTATLTVTAPGFTSTQGNVNVVAPALQIESLASSISATATSDIFQVRVGIADSFNNKLTQAQAVAAGSSLVATVTNSAAGVAQLVTAAGGAQSRTAPSLRGHRSLRRQWRVEASNSIRSLPEPRPSSRPSRESSRLPPGR